VLLLKELAVAPSTRRLTASITLLVSAEMIEGLVSLLRKRTMVAMVWVEPIVNAAVKVTRAMKPRAGSDEQPAVEPIRAVRSIGCTVVRGDIVAAIWTNGRGSDVDGYLSGGKAREAHQKADQGR